MTSEPITEAEYREKSIRLLSSIQANISCLMWIVFAVIILLAVSGGCSVFFLGLGMQ